MRSPLCVEGGSLNQQTRLLARCWPVEEGSHHEAQAGQVLNLKTRSFRFTARLDNSLLAVRVWRVPSLL